MSFERRICDQIPHLQLYARALCDNPGQAEDLVQDCLERALRKRHLWMPGRSVRPWLFRMLYRLYLNDRASARRRWESLAPDAGLERPQEARQEPFLACHEAIEAMRALPPEQRAALLLMVLESPGYAEAARILGIKVGTLRSRLSRARETLRQVLDGPVRGGGRPRLRRVK